MSNDESYRKIVAEALARAQACWNKVGGYFRLTEDAKIANSIAKTDSSIPGYPGLGWDDFEHSLFVAMVVDIRGSTKHLIEATKRGRPTQIQRVFYETSALLAVVDEISRKNSGKVTEYLGDGALTLFRVKDDDIGHQHKMIHAANRAAREILTKALPIVNSELKKVDIDPIKIGIGLAYDRAIVTRIGTEQNSHAKAIGACVYHASKLADQENLILYHQSIELAWPVSNTGTLHFGLFHHKTKLKAYRIEA